MAWTAAWPPMRPFLLLLAAAALLAGCSSPATHPAAPSSSQAHAASLAGAQPQTVVARRELQQWPIQVDGTTSTGGCVGTMSTWECRYANGKDDFDPLPTEGTPVRLNGTVTWDAATPASPGLNVYLLVSDAGGGYQYLSSTLVSGTSPLSFDYDLAPYAGSDIAVGVSTTSGEYVVAAGASAGTPQDFHLDATYSAVVLKA